MASNKDILFILDLVHLTDGVDGAKKRIAAAEKYTTNLESLQSVVSAGGDRKPYLICYRFM